MSFLLEYFGATFWPAAAQCKVNPFSGPLAAMLLELQEKCQTKRLLDRAEAGHMDIESRKAMALLLLDWHAAVSGEKPTDAQLRSESPQDIELHRTTRLLCIEKRLYELCEAEQDWFFAIESDIRCRVLSLLAATAENSNDSALIYYKNALLLESRK